MHHSAENCSAFYALYYTTLHCLNCITLQYCMLHSQGEPLRGVSGQCDDLTQPHLRALQGDWLLLHALCADPILIGPSAKSRCFQQLLVGYQILTLMFTV